MVADVDAVGLFVSSRLHPTHRGSTVRPIRPRSRLPTRHHTRTSSCRKRIERRCCGCHGGCGHRWFAQCGLLLMAASPFFCAGDEACPAAKRPLGCTEKEKETGHSAVPKHFAATAPKPSGCFAFLSSKARSIAPVKVKKERDPSHGKVKKKRDPSHR